MVNAEEELAKKKRNKVLGIFPVRGDGARSASGSSTPTANGVAVDAAGGVVAPRRGSIEEYDEDADEPPREEADLGDLSSPGAEASHVVHQVVDREEEESVKDIPKTAGFDFDAIGRELGKDIDPDKLRPDPQPNPIPMPPADALERTGSAPPISIAVHSGTSDPFSPSRLARSASYVHTARTPEEEDDDAGDITRSTSDLTVTDMPSWGRPDPSPPVSASAGSSSSLKLPAIGGWNAWSGPTTEAPPRLPSPSLRAAPPARPHPTEWMDNPFASASSGLGSGTNISANGFGAWGSARSKGPEEDATKNPW